MTAYVRLVAMALVLFVPALATAQHQHDHSQHQVPASPPSAPAPPESAPSPPEPAPADHSAHAHGSADRATALPADASLPLFIPPITDSDRAAAFPDVEGHVAHDNRVNYFVLFDTLEWQSGSGTSALHWDNVGWVGRDLDRLWFRTEGDRDEDGGGHAEAQVFYGRAIGRCAGWGHISTPRILLDLPPFRSGAMRTM